MAASMAGLRPLSESRLTLEVPAEDVRDRKVFDANGNHVGSVADLMVDETEKKVRFLRVAQGGFLGIGERHYLVPVDAVVNVTDEAVTIDRGHEHLADAPDYDPDLAAADGERPWGDVYDYWGYPPFWSAGYVYPTYPLYPAGHEEGWERLDRQRWESD